MQFPGTPHKVKSLYNFLALGVHKVVEFPSFSEGSVKVRQTVLV